MTAIITCETEQCRLTWQSTPPNSRVNVISLTSGVFFRIATFTTLTLNVANMMYGSWYRKS